MSSHRLLTFRYQVVDYTLPPAALAGGFVVIPKTLRVVEVENVSHVGLIDAFPFASRAASAQSVVMVSVVHHGRVSFSSSLELLLVLGLPLPLLAGAVSLIRGPSPV
jgi:hypothetical protein